MYTNKTTEYKAGKAKRIPKIPSPPKLGCFYEFQILGRNRVLETRTIRIDNVITDRHGHLTYYTKFYTHDQVIDICEKAGVLCPTRPSNPDALYSSTQTGAMTVKSTLVRVMEPEVVGVLDKNPVQVFSINQDNSLEEYARDLLTRGFQSGEDIDWLLDHMREVDFVVEDVPSYTGTCECCKLRRKITKRVDLGEFGMLVGRSCLVKMDLAHRMIHMDGDEEDLLDEFENLYK